MRTESQIIKLRPEFKFGGITMIEWFEVTKGAGFYCLRSGLKHADGETKSPYFFEMCVGGKNAKKQVLNHFNNWYDGK